MSSEMQKFYGMALRDPALMNELIEITDPQSFAKKMVELGMANACSFTEADVIAWYKEMAAALANNELDEQQLDAVAGGRMSIPSGFARVIRSVISASSDALSSTRDGIRKR